MIWIILDISLMKTKPLELSLLKHFINKSPFNGPFLLELWEKAVLQAAYGFKWQIQTLEGLMRCYY